MIGAAILLYFASYGVASYGWVLVKGYNITFKQWWSPLNPYQWPPPGQSVPTVPLGSLMPTAGGAPPPGLGGLGLGANAAGPNVGSLFPKITPDAPQGPRRPPVI